MKLLAVHSIGTDNPSGIDYWRVHKPIEELRKHVDWTIDVQSSFIPGAEKYLSSDDFTEEELTKAAEKLGSYDIIFSSYQPSPFVFSLLKLVEKKYGTKYVLDDDDDVFSIEPDSTFWLKGTQEDAYAMQRMIELASTITTTTKRLKDRYREKTTSDIHVLPNFISNDYKGTAKTPDDRIDIVYFGGANHYFDLHETGVLEALKKLMNTHKNVHFRSIGNPIDEYLPKKRYSEQSPSNVLDWVHTVYPEIRADIAIAPVRNTAFTLGKSNIKWQEATRLGAAFVASDIAPYADLPVGTFIRTENTAQSWYEALETALDPLIRKETVANAQKELEANWTLEKQWTIYRDTFEAIKSNLSKNGIIK